MGAAVPRPLAGQTAQIGSSDDIEALAARLSKPVFEAAHDDICQFVRSVSEGRVTRQGALVAARSWEILLGHAQDAGLFRYTEKLLRDNSDRLATRVLSGPELQRMEDRLRVRGCLLPGSSLWPLANLSTETRRAAIDNALNAGMHTSLLTVTGELRRIAQRLGSEAPPTEIARASRYRNVFVDPICYDLWAMLAIAVILHSEWAWACWLIHAPICALWELLAAGGVVAIIFLLWWHGCPELH